MKRLIAAGVLLLILGGCSNGDGQSGSSTTTPSTPATDAQREIPTALADGAPVQAATKAPPELKQPVLQGVVAQASTPWVKACQASVAEASQDQQLRFYGAWVSPTGGGAGFFRSDGGILHCNALPGKTGLEVCTVGDSRTSDAAQLENPTGMNACFTDDPEHTFVFTWVRADADCESIAVVEPEWTVLYPTQGLPSVRVNERIRSGDAARFDVACVKGTTLKWRRNLDVTAAG